MTKQVSIESTTNPTISAVMTSYNYANLLPDAIEAILSQSLQPDELIIIDDASTDNSVEIIKKYLRHSPIIKLVQKEQNEGVIAALNHGLNVAKGHYIIYVAADDLVFPRLFEESVTLLEKYLQAAFCTSLVTVIEKNGTYRGRWPIPDVVKNHYVTPDESLWLLRRFGFWCVANTVVFRRNLLLEAGGFFPELGPLCDAFICQVLALRHGICFIPKSMAELRMREGSYSKNLGKDIQGTLGIIGSVVKLMKTTYADLFPKAFAEEWRSVGYLFYGSRAWREEVLDRQRLFIKNTIPLFRTNFLWVDRGFGLILTVFSWVQAFLFFLYFFVAFWRRLLFSRYFYYSFRRGWNWLKQSVVD